MTIPFRYDPEVDAGYIRLSNAPVDHTVDLEPTTLGLPVLIDVDASGALVGIEILNVTTTAPSLT
ncbi:DUF2283 domain-containing protein [Microbacterium insulae]|uniref:DUF2283 domain-containing protein n=1 Tax=Microbacterium insulae TaxID=483014 RepID=A0ABW3AKQ3_9MICO